MKLLYITATFPYGSGEAFLAAEVEELLRRGCDMRLVPRNPQGDIIHNNFQQLQGRTIATSLFSLPVLLAACGEFLRRPLAASQSLMLIMRSGNVTTILKNLAVFPKGLWLAGIARRFGADHIHAHWISTPATMAMVASQLSGIRWSCTAHRVDIVHNNLLSQKVASARFVRFISESGRAMAIEFGMRDPDNKALVLHVGVSLPAEIDAEATTSSADPFTALCAANLYPVKGHEYLIRAVALLRDRGAMCRLQIVGRGECQDGLEALVRELNLADRVQFIGQLSHDRLLSMYCEKQVQIAVLPSIDLGHHLHEGIPVSLMEAMVYGIPVVSTATGGIPELLSDGAGLLVEEKNPAALADAIEKLLVDVDLRQQLAIAGRRRIAERFEVCAITNELLSKLRGNCA